MRITRHQYRLMDENKENGGGGGTGYEAGKSEAATATSGSTESTGAESEGDTDDLGYAVVKEKPAAPENKEGTSDDKSKPAETAKPKEVTPGTGYSAEGASTETPPPKTEITTEDEASKLEFEVKAEGIPDAELKEIKTFAKANKLSKEQTQAYLDLRKSALLTGAKAQEDAKIAAENARKQQRSQWHQELVNDPAWKGEKFGENLKVAERVLDEHFPQLKKSLTERGGMLPPYHMRELVKLGELLYKTENLVEGQAPDGANKSSEDDALDFYK